MHGSVKTEVGQNSLPVSIAIRSRRQIRVLPLETGDSLNTAFFKDNWVSL